MVRIPIKKYVMDPTLSWEERYRALEKHHEEETKWLIQQVAKTSSTCTCGDGVRSSRCPSHGEKCAHTVGGRCDPCATAYRQFHEKSKTGLVPWPDYVPARYNACTDPCDMWTGPCACGATHRDGI